MTTRPALTHRALILCCNPFLLLVLSGGSRREDHECGGLGTPGRSHATARDWQWLGETWTSRADASLERGCLAEFLPIAFLSSSSLYAWWAVWFRRLVSATDPSTSAYWLLSLSILPTSPTLEQFGPHIPSFSPSCSAVYIPISALRVLIFISLQISRGKRSISWPSYHTHVFGTSSSRDPNMPSRTRGSRSISGAFNLSNKTSMFLEVTHASSSSSSSSSLSGSASPTMNTMSPMNLWTTKNLRSTSLMDVSWRGFKGVSTRTPGMERICPRVSVSAERTPSGLAWPDLARTKTLKVFIRHIES
ncbi:hypothetical protein C8J57DRAFT_255988 [Mycena rebaudengoi]|nr:hypothetical protein C8J57DRAFT_255988 [Mycena rebaudengoi]